MSMIKNNRKEGGGGCHSTLNEHGGGHNARIQLGNGVIQRDEPGGGSGGFKVDFGSGGNGGNGARK